MAQRYRARGAQKLYTYAYDLTQRETTHADLSWNSQKLLVLVSFGKGFISAHGSKFQSITEVPVVGA